MSVPDDFDAFCDWVLQGMKANEGGNMTLNQIIHGEMFAHLLQAQKNVPRAAAHWEIAAFFGWATAGSVALLKWERITSYQEYQILAERLFGTAAKQFFPSLFAASILSPSVESEFRERFVEFIETLG